MQTLAHLATLYGMNRIGDNLLCFAANEEIVRTFDAHKVEYLVVGGLAVSWYCSDRQAADMDLLVKPSVENSSRVNGALVELGITGINEMSFARPGIQAPLKQRHYADVITPAKKGRSYAEIAEGAVAGKLFGLPIRIPSVASLILMKEAAVASSEAEAKKHQQDISFLKNKAV